jgi:organic radical activating enzyme
VKPGYLSEIFTSFQGEGAHVGRRHLFVRLAGCNIRCRYCDTPDSLERTATYTIYASGSEPEVRENPVDAVELSGIVRQLILADPPIDAIALTGGEPLTQSEFLAAFLEVGRFAVPVLLETNGILPRRLREVLPWVDIISMDIKLPSNTDEGEFWESHAEFLEMARGKDLYVKVLVDAGTGEADVERAAQLVASIGPTAPVFLQPIVDPAGQAMITVERLTDLYRVAWRSVGTVRVLPQTHKLLGIR